MFCSIYTINFSTAKLAANCFDVIKIFAFTFTILAISENLDKNIFWNIHKNKSKGKIRDCFLAYLGTNNITRILIWSCTFHHLILGFALFISFSFIWAELLYDTFTKELICNDLSTAKDVANWFYGNEIFVFILLFKQYLKNLKQIRLKYSIKKHFFIFAHFIR